jgi:ATP-dependent 26S proteasome regulatory subunit
MNERSRQDWHEANRTYLSTSLAGLRRLLESDANEPVERGDELTAMAENMPAPPALVVLTRLFGLSNFERDVLTLCAGAELDSRMAAALPGGTVTFGMALATLPEAHWSALAPTRPLRRWRLVEMTPGRGVTAAPLAIDERTLHFLTGVNSLDERLFGSLRPLPLYQVDDLAPSQRTVAERIENLWSTSGTPVIELDGADHGGKLAIAGVVAGHLGVQVSQVSACDIPAAPAERETLSLLLQREAALTPLIVLLDLRNSAGQAGLGAFVDSLDCAVILTNDRALIDTATPTCRLTVDPPTPAEQRRMWRAALGDSAATMDKQIDRVAAQFRLDDRAMRAAAVEARTASEHSNGSALWQACRTQACARLDEMAQRIEPLATWEQLVLPDSQIETLRDIARQMRQRTRVYEDWGFARVCNRGLGISALFAGPSGTGKTMAAEVLANELMLDLFRIDLSQVISKYIGETEKNLSRVFDAAEQGGAILLFDEADAIFGKRSEVRDSHDRYANIEVSYLLQRMEAYRGIAILTTNMKEALDRAFLRRIRFIVRFPFPDAAQRAQIWAGAFPDATPTERLDIERLARLNVAGGNIRNIAMNAAFLAAERGEAVNADDVLRAARNEYSKVDKSISETELRGWR